MASFPQASPPTPCAQLYPPPYALHALPISFVLIGIYILAHNRSQLPHKCVGLKDLFLWSHYRTTIELTEAPTTTVPTVKHSSNYSILGYRTRISEKYLTTAAWFNTVEQPQILHSLTRLWECQGQTGKQYKKRKWLDKFRLTFKNLASYI
jgi:hypothetical protein